MAELTYSRPVDGRVIPFWIPESAALYAASDPDSAAYIAAVEAADGQALELQVRSAVEAFIVGCKADGIWDAIKATCIMAGARTLAGALVPLKGAAPTNFNFVSGDYDRKTGLKGNGSTKYLDSNRNNNAEPQDSKSLCVYASETASLTSLGIGCAVTSTSGRSGINFSPPSNTNFRINGASHSAAGILTTGFLGGNRNSSATLIHRAGGTTSSTASTSETPLAENIGVFATVTQANPTNARLSFYSIGEALDLALLDARVATLMSTFTSVIP
ncbi:hypothetical protein SCBWM1_gp87 [Synechococcus phage S-CBWM1]|uniref:Uncharacterized protein n=1 Tax=Synechococcus phage S-CBWM1 TaxID=2053653 RepID=A0A3G1L3L2_9CAUD|nr:hypothetical protein HOU61_gp110 [Synechococcus phage S-CBWM1]ATW62771.1 hypothetical protein SCBWM1_gp87 [Synechococcus phage S-CBWM1]